MGFRVTAWCCCPCSPHCSYVHLTGCMNPQKNKKTLTADITAAGSAHAMVVNVKPFSNPRASEASESVQSSAQVGLDVE